MFGADKLIAVQYPAGAGGKFLINCLGLSDGVLFQDYVLATNQINGKFSPSDKINLILQRVNNQLAHWNDLNLGLNTRFHYHSETKYMSEEEVNQINLQTNSDNVKMIAESNKVCVVGTCRLSGLYNFVKEWKSPAVIMFNNCDDFVMRRNTTTPSSNEDIFLPAIIEMVPTDSFVYWDNENYFNERDTIEGIHNLYKRFKLPSFNEGYVVSYYRAWIKAIFKKDSNE